MSLQLYSFYIISCLFAELLNIYQHGCSFSERIKILDSFQSTSTRVSTLVLSEACILMKGQGEVLAQEMVRLCHLDVARQHIENLEQELKSVDAEISNRIAARELVFKGFREEISMTTEQLGMQIKKQSIFKINQEIHLCFTE